METRLTAKKTLQKIASAYNRSTSLEEAAKEFNMGQTAFRRRLIEAREAGINVREAKRGGPAQLTDDDCREAVDAMSVYGAIGAAAEALGIAPSSLRHRLAAAAQRDIKPKLVGSDDARQPIVRPFPAKGKIARYILTCAQNNTLLHEPTWAALQTMAEHYGAELLISTFTYNKSKDGSGKRGTKRASDDDGEWYDERIEHGEPA